MLLQIFHLFLAAVATYYLVGKLKWSKREHTVVRGIDGWQTALASLGFGTGLVWILGWGAGYLGVHSGLNWLVGGLAAYALNDIIHEVKKAKKGKAGEHGKPD